MIEVTYDYYLGGQMMDGYQDGDNRMAQASIDAACESATLIERERIIKLLQEHPCFSLETCQQGCLAHDLLVANIALIKGEQK